MIKRNSLFRLLFVLLSSSFMLAAPSCLFAEKHRLIVTTDIGGTDPDDEQSMVHLLLMSDDVDIEGLICNVAFVKTPLGLPVLNKIIDAYEKAYPNLIVHDKGYPSAASLRSVAVAGQAGVGMADVGEGHDTPGSELIIRAVDSKDPRPVWVNAWGGMNTVAQALWKVKHTRSAADVAKFVSKLRIYDVLGQCDAGAWIARTFPDIVYLRNTAVYGWAPSDSWVDDNVQKYGPLGAAYPDRMWATEGDSPAFMFLVDNGLNMPSEPEYGGWGGRFGTEKVAGVRGMDWVEKNNLDEKQYDPYYMFTNSGEGSEAIARWKTAILNDFAARVKWSVCADNNDANHHPVVRFSDEKTDTKAVRYVDAKPGDRLQFDFSGSYDPDGNEISYRLYVYDDATDCDQRLEVSDAATARPSLSIPESVSKATIHLIQEVTDSGSPALTSYRRIVVRVK